MLLVTDNPCLLTPSFSPRPFLYHGLPATLVTVQLCKALCSFCLRSSPTPSGFSRFTLTPSEARSDIRSLQAHSSLSLPPPHTAPLNTRVKHFCVVIWLSPPPSYPCWLCIMVVNQHGEKSTDDKGLLLSHCFRGVS